MQRIAGYSAATSDTASPVSSVLWSLTTTTSYGIDSLSTVRQSVRSTGRMEPASLRAGITTESTSARAGAGLSEDPCELIAVRTDPADQVDGHVFNRAAGHPAEARGHAAVVRDVDGNIARPGGGMPFDRDGDARQPAAQVGELGERRAPVDTAAGIEHLAV